VREREEDVKKEKAPTRQPGAPMALLRIVAVKAQQSSLECRCIRARERKQRKESGGRSSLVSEVSGLGQSMALNRTLPHSYRGKYL
jgi:hypothetical protein